MKPILLCGWLLPLIGFGSSYARDSKEDLQIYFIDVDGGQSTLIVTPGHQSLLIDAGFPGSGTFESRPGDPGKARDANRVAAAARDAGITRIDFLLNTHFHGDHMGGIPELTRLLPVDTFVDHGRPDPNAESTSPGTMALFKAYEKVRSKGKHLEPKPGEHLPLKDLDVEVVSTAGDTVARSGRANPACRGPAVPPGEPNENPQSTGVLVKFGHFSFLDIGDLTGEPLHRLACPEDLIGPVDVYLVAHHGGADAADPAVFASLRPRVAILNNGLKKGGALATFELLHRVEGLQDVWQLHRSESAKEMNFADAHIANLDESSAHWIKLGAGKDGSFTLLNARNGEEKHYPPAGER